jgi:hypothetical protein
MRILFKSFIVSTLGLIFSGIILCIFFCLKKSPFNWGLFRFALLMGYLQQIIIITPILFLCKIFLERIRNTPDRFVGKFAKIAYYLLFIILFYSSRVIIGMDYSIDLFSGATFELLSIIGFDLFLCKNHGKKQNI